VNKYTTLIIISDSPRKTPSDDRHTYAGIKDLLGQEILRQKITT